MPTPLYLYLSMADTVLGVRRHGADTSGLSDRIFRGRGYHLYSLMVFDKYRVHKSTEKLYKRYYYFICRGNLPILPIKDDT